MYEYKWFGGDLHGVVEVESKQVVQMFTDEQAAKDFVSSLNGVTDPALKTLPVVQQTGAGFAGGEADLKRKGK